jgi:hypothetical protein
LGHRPADKTHKEHENAWQESMLSGDFFENYEKLDGFFQILKDENQFRRYKTVVIDRDDFAQPSCNSCWEEVLEDMVEGDGGRTAELALSRA